MKREPTSPTEKHSYPEEMPRVHKLEDSHLIDDLIQLSKKEPKLVKSTESPVPGCEEITVRSWKMNEFKYYDVPSPFPTLARGLFTTGVNDDEGTTNDVRIERGVKHRIVVRGYDKFFNIGEVPWTTWESLKDHTAAPYILSLKSNGCIIFIAAITATKLIVTSKHSLGQVPGKTGTEVANEDDRDSSTSISHAMMGRRWLNRYLAKKEKQESDLAKVLWDNGWTAIAELCDDSFEEHVLPYPPHQTGLHLHGINNLSKHFSTLPPPLVDAFAEEWGFIPTPTITLSSIEDVRAFAEECGTTGKWNDEAVEGFVVRTSVASIPTGKNSSSPYERGSSFFFKIKFDEPYMMYRDWRELTKQLLALRLKLGNPGMKSDKLAKGKMKRPETKRFVAWIISDIQGHPELYEEYGKNKGIIASRERYFKWAESDDSGAASDQAEGPSTKKEFGKTVIVPVAIPGCGKTTVSLALAKLFGWGHTQSDNVQAKKSALAFIRNVVDCLQDHNVVIADKNNHLRLHRMALRNATSSLPSLPVRLVALNWALDKPPAMIHRICSDRIMVRGQNHQTLVPEAGRKAHHEEVVWMFINTTEDLSPSEVDEIVDMEINADEGIRDQIVRALDGLTPILNIEKPSEESIDEAIEWVKQYEVDIAEVKTTKQGGEKGNGKGKSKAGSDGSGKAQRAKDTVRYYAILPEFDLKTFLNSEIQELESSSTTDQAKLQNLKGVWERLKKDNRVTKRPHVTIAHRNGLKELSGEGNDGRQVWDRCGQVNEMIDPPLFEGVIRRVVWSKKVMSVTFEDFRVVYDPVGEAKESPAENLNSLAISDSNSDPARSSKTSLKVAKGLVDELPGSVRKRLHVTVGTRDGGVAPVEGKWVVERWRDFQKGMNSTDQESGEDEDVWSVEIQETKVTGLLKGLTS